MSKQNETSLANHTKQETITPANKRTMAYILALVLTLCLAIIITSFKL